MELDDDDDDPDINDDPTQREAILGRSGVSHPK